MAKLLAMECRCPAAKAVQELQSPASSGIHEEDNRLARPPEQASADASVALRASALASSLASSSLATYATSALGSRALPGDILD